MDEYRKKIEKETIKSGLNSLTYNDIIKIWAVKSLNIDIDACHVIQQLYYKSIYHKNTYSRLADEFLEGQSINDHKNRSIFTQALYGLNIQFSNEQITHMFSILTFDQLNIINLNLDNGKEWF